MCGDRIKWAHTHAHTPTLTHTKCVCECVLAGYYCTSYARHKRLAE